MLVGALLSLLAAVTYTVGNLIEKVAVEKLPEFSAARPAHMTRALVSSRLWLFGFVISLVGLAVQVLAFSRTSVLVVQAVFGGAIVLLVIVARWHLRESLSRAELVGLAIALPGIALVTVSLGSSSGGPGARSPVAAVVVTAGVTAVFAIVAYIGLRRRYGNAGIVYGLCSGLFYGVAALGSKGASTYVIRYGLLHSIARIFSSTYPYLFVVASLLGLLVYQQGLQRCRIAVVAPVSSVATSLYVAIVGTILFGEHLPSSTSTLVLRIVGFGAVVVGSYLLGGSELAITRPSVPSGESPSRADAVAE